MCKSELKMVKKNMKQGWTCALRNLLQSLRAAHLAKNFCLKFRKFSASNGKTFFHSFQTCNLIGRSKNVRDGARRQRNKKTDKTNFRCQHNEITLSLPQRDPLPGHGDESPYERGLVLSRTHFMVEEITVVFINTQTK